MSSLWSSFCEDDKKAIAETISETELKKKKTKVEGELNNSIGRNSYMGQLMDDGVKEAGSKTLVLI